MKVLKGYNSATTAKRRLLAVCGEQVLNNPKGDKNEKAKVNVSGSTNDGWNGINRLFVAARSTKR